MNILEILSSRVDELGAGDYIQGLRAVLQHIEVAEKHLDRGKGSGDDTAFTDAIYRTNQAFEGSLKEAFRVLAGKDPSRETPNNIEIYLQKHHLLRPRVLAQLTNYRTEWRNPSTHDYRLDFDEDEALFAIVAVSAFAIVLVDQITERIAYDLAKTIAAEHPSPSPPEESLLERTANLLEHFVVQFSGTHVDKTDVREVEVIGALSGFLDAAASDLNFESDTLSPHVIGDLLVNTENEVLVIEVKTGRRRWNKAAIQHSISRMVAQPILNHDNDVILFFYSGENSGRFIREEQLLPKNRRLLVLAVI